MFLEILLAILLGVSAGVFTGLIPGLHINLISIVVVSFLQIDSFLAVIGITAMSVTHSFLDAIPSIYLGAPDPSMILATLPGHKLVQEGKGHEAIMLTAFGSYWGLLISIVLSPILYFLVQFIYTFISGYIGYILAILIIYLFYKDKNGIFLFFLSGILGFIIFDLPLNQPLLPLLSGLFGISVLLTSLSQPSLPKQHSKVTYTKERIPLFISVLAGFCASFLPGFGSSQAGIFAAELIKKVTPQTMLVLTGGINTVNMVLSFVTMTALQKARNGAVVAMSQIIEFTPELLLFLLVVCIISGSLAVILTKYCSLLFQKILVFVPYKLTVWTVILFLIGMTVYFDQGIGFLILSTSTGLGVYAVKKEIAKHYLLGCLLLPVLSYFLLS